jgi:hypothetical protein
MSQPSSRPARNRSPARSSNDTLDGPGQDPAVAGKEKTMLNYSKPALAGLLVALAGVTLWSADGSRAGSEAAHCEIGATVTGSMIALTGQAAAAPDVSGTYRLTVKGSGANGSTNISQGGRFTTSADGTATLGKMMLTNSGAVYEADLTIAIGSETCSSSETFGGRI